MPTGRESAEQQNPRAQAGATAVGERSEMTPAAGAPPAPDPVAAPGGGARAGSWRRRAWRAGHAAGDYLGVGGLLLILVIFLSITQSQFATKANWINIAQTNAVLLVLSTGLTFVLLVGGFDLSIGGTLAFTSVVFYELLQHGMSVGPAILMMLVMGALLGLANGIAVAWIGLSFLVVTLASSSIYRGIAEVITGGQSQSLPIRHFLDTLGSGTTVAGIPWSVVIALVVLVAGILVLRYTGYGRMIYAVGGNPEAARLAGINTTAVRASVYVIAGLLAALAGLLESTLLTEASPTGLLGVELTAGAAVLLGGTTFMGGRGTLLGTLLGVIFLGVLQNGITLIGISAFWQLPVSGAVLVVALLLQRLRGRQVP
jgi:ribose transport system permease protein